MSRTTIDIDSTVMRELKRRQLQEGKPIGRIVSELLASALAQSEPTPIPDFAWTARGMGALVDLEDKEALRRALDGNR
jgi:hypothetical protein